MKTNLIMLSVTFLLLGCSKFLDITPQDKQTEKQVYGTKSGFYMASNGIYTGLASDVLYGSNMTYQLMDVIAKRYEVPNSNLYLRDLVSYNYTSPYVAPALSNIWAKSYELILACNFLLKNLDQQQILNQVESNTLRGEMLAVRAFLHFDMLRLFGPVWDNNPSALTIPYNESSKVSVLPLLSYEQVIEKLLRDLNEAEKLLVDDPVISNGPMASHVDNESIQLRYRQFRFNYYAVKALKARVYLYIGQKENALATATSVINDVNVKLHFPATDPEKLLANSTNPDRVFSSEILTAVYVGNRDNAFNQYFSAQNAGNNLLKPYDQYVNTRLFGFIYGLSGSTETEDYRYQSQWETATGNNVSGMVFTKYKPISKPTTSNQGSEYFYSKMIALFRLSELYYIAAECEKDPDKGLIWMNQMRIRRGLAVLPDGFGNTLTKQGLFSMFLSNEYLREFYGEGQAFYFFKRTKTSQAYENGQMLNYANYIDAAYRPALPIGEMK